MTTKDGFEKRIFKLIDMISANIMEDLKIMNQRKNPFNITNSDIEECINKTRADLRKLINE